MLWRPTYHRRIAQLADGITAGFSFIAAYFIWMFAKVIFPWVPFGREIEVNISLVENRFFTAEATEIKASLAEITGNTERHLFCSQSGDTDWKQRFLLIWRHLSPDQKSYACFL